MLANGDYQDAKHLADYVALISRLIFLAALSAIIWQHAITGTDKLYYMPLAACMVLLALHLMKHLYWMTYDYISRFLGEAQNDRREMLVLLLSLAVTLAVVTGVSHLFMEIVQSNIGIGAWITSHDQP